MRFRVRSPSPWPPPLHLLASARRPPSRRIHAANSRDSQGKGKFLLPGATAAVLVMLGALHARRMYDDKKVSHALQDLESSIIMASCPHICDSFLCKVVQRKEKGIEPQFSPDLKDIPVFMRPTIYKAWARAFHSDLQEVALPLEEYPSLQAFFIRSLKEGARPIDPDPNCLVSPVDGKVLRLGELKDPGTLIEQVKGFSYSVSSLLGTSSSLHDAAEEELSREHIERHTPENSDAKSWWRISVASPKLRDRTLLSVFAGHLFPQNERAVRTIRNLYVENERVVLEGRWKEGFVAIAAIGATNVGSIRVNVEPELRTNRAVSRMVRSLPPEERVYEPEGTGVVVKKGEEIAGFKMGSTVVVVFEAPAWKRKAIEDSSASGEFSFCVRAGDKVRVGEAIGIGRRPPTACHLPMWDCAPSSYGIPSSHVLGAPAALRRRGRGQPPRHPSLPVPRMPLVFISSTHSSCISSQLQPTKLNCGQDAVGIVAKLSDCIASRGGNIHSVDVFVPDHKPVFYSRSEFTYNPRLWPRDELREDFLNLSRCFSAQRSTVRVPDLDPKYKVSVLASKQDHCLFDLLYRWQEGRLPVDINCVISNHDRPQDNHVRRFLQRHGIPYHYLPTTSGNKREQDILELIQGTDFLVLARYMQTSATYISVTHHFSSQIMSESFLKAYGKDIINIHHGLLPSFKGGHPSRQAFNAGVKLIGATSHFVTPELDAGPIIEQMVFVERVSHRDTLQSFVVKSENLEKQCLAEAIKSYCELRVLPYELKKTVVF
ncbi:Phosphatidylserine decarboxylase proenzyme 1, mitochondrial [Dichanthelium oligosanthes]|uniref:phosphatidylserine decarboxylase n=1 Tax=Dichanthelium oligosanthes TaxID=888268 RepID=A0A1E5VPQ5_9POAL|nr:Phosphatidylserine decarboxylase proenzyme 1, mitochondrial [Dichanthelium oligosanthes]